MTGSMHVSGNVLEYKRKLGDVDLGGPDIPTMISDDDIRCRGKEGYLSLVLADVFLPRERDD